MTDVPGGWFAEALRRAIDGRPVILAGGMASNWGPVLDRLREAAAGEVMIAAPDGEGAGAPPEVTTWAGRMPDGLAHIEQIRWSNGVLADPPGDLVATIDRFDPRRRAVVLGTFLLEAPALAGRPALFHRRPEWIALEDKTIADELWHRAGIAAAPAEVVALYDAWAAAQRLDRGQGTVWSMDNSGGWHGGAAGVRWVTSSEQADDTLVAWRGRTEQVRVMPLIEGIPCSIHGIVLPDGVVALRPVEMVTLRHGNTFRYCGCASFWDPTDDVREEMRLVARRVGAQLRREVDFAGAFTVDGVVGVDGFRPTELNPRAGAGLSTLGRGMPELPLVLMCGLAAGGHDLGIGAQALEAELLAAADAVRGGGTWTIGVRPAAGETEPTELQAAALSFDGRQWTADGLADRRSSADADVRRGIADVSAGFTRCIFDATSWPVGPSVGAAAAAFYEWCDAHCATNFGELVPAVDAQIRAQSGPAGSDKLAR